MYRHLLPSLLLIAASLFALAPAPLQAQSPAAEADALLERYVEAIGGREALLAIRSRSTQMKLSSGLIRLGIISRQIAPDLYEETATMLGLSGGSGYDGSTAWTRKGDDYTVLQGRELQRQVFTHRLDRVTRLAEMYPQRRRLPDAQAGGQTLQRVELTSTLGEVEIWSFDATGLLRRVDTTQDKGEDGGVVAITLTLDDYRAQDGVRLAHRIVAQEGRKKITMQVESVAHNQPMPPIRYPGPAHLR